MNDLYIPYQRAKALLGESYGHVKNSRYGSKVEIEGEWFDIYHIDYPNGWVLKPETKIIGGFSLSHVIEGFSNR